MDRQAQERYRRQLAIEEIGETGQQKLAEARVLVVGAGGLGSPVCLYLAAAGIGRLGIVEADKVSLSNLNRQVLYSTSDVGKSKADAASERLRSLNPLVQVSIYEERFSGEKAFALAREYDVLVDATDNLETRDLINRVCLTTGKPFFHGAVSSFYGQVMTVIPGRGPCWRCFMGDPLPTSRAQGVPVLGPVAGAVGSLQALQVLKYFLGIGDLLVGKVLMFDGRSASCELFTVARDPDCPACRTL